MAVLSDERWKGKQSEPRIRVDYVYVCRGFKGSLDGLMRVFEIGQLVLDTSLSDWRRTNLKEACEQAKLPCCDMNENGSFRIHLPLLDSKR